MRRSLVPLLLLALLLRAAPGHCHAGREFVIAYAQGETAARVLAHALGMVALDRLGFDVRILSLRSEEIPARAAAGEVSLAILPAPAGEGGTPGWNVVQAPTSAGPWLWGRYLHAGGELRLLVPVREREDLRFDAVAATLGKALSRIDLAFFASLGRIPISEGRFSGPLRTSLEGRGIL